MSVFDKQYELVHRFRGYKLSLILKGALSFQEYKDAAFIVETFHEMFVIEYEKNPTNTEKALRDWFQKRLRFYTNRDNGIYEEEGEEEYDSWWTPELYVHFSNSSAFQNLLKALL